MFERDLSPTNDTQTSDHPSGSLSESANEQRHVTFNQEKAKKKDDMGHSPTLCPLYACLEAPEFSRLAAPLSSEQVHSIALRAQKKRHVSVLDNLSRNILDSPEAVRANLATTLLSIPYLRLNPSLTASLLSCVIPDHISSISLKALSYIASTLIHRPSSSNTDELLTRLAEDIAHRLKPLWKKTHGPRSSGRHSVRIWSLFQLVVRLSALRLREPAMRIFQSLLEKAYIPPEAIQRLDQSSGDFHLIIILTLVRSCIFWKWNRKALALLRSYIDREAPVGPVINRLCQDVLYALTEFPTVEDLYLGFSFVKDMVSGPEPIFVPPSVVRQIYSSAEFLRQPQIATSLYMLTQSEPVASSHEFPLPSGTSLTWFLRYLSNQAAYLHLARRLVNQVVDRGEHIPLEDRAEFITIAAQSGFASPARTLWERYSSGKGGRTVAGNAAMVVRMCSLFASLRREKAAQISEIPRLADKMTTSSVPSGPHGDANDDLHTSLLEDIKDFRNFANLVLTKYRKAKAPFRQASREDLNALARASIILGHVTAGFRALHIVVDRHGRPDLHDVNVMLSAVAAVDPRMALKMVRQMVALGPKPDGISFGTVIHQAANQGSFSVIIGVLRLAQKTGQQLTTKTMVTVIRASVSLDGEDRDAVRDNLVLALQVIVANEYSDHLATLNMGRFCVDEALRADDPSLAFEFWKRVLKRRAEWDDGSHVSMRRRIASSIRSHCKKGDIRAEDGHRMAFALRGGRAGKGRQG